MQLSWPDREDGKIPADAAPPLASDASPSRPASDVEDVADRVELQHLRRSIEDLRRDVAGLRHAVLEAVHSQEGSSLGAHGDLGPGVAAALDDLAESLGNDVRHLAQSILGTADGGAAAPAAVAHELVELRTEMVALRRRISLRASGSTLTPDELTAIADAVAERLRVIPPA